jgi:large subunit ribosomal protein L22
MEIKSVQKFLIMSPRKLRVVADAIRDLQPTEAFEKLPFIKKRAAVPLRKVVGAAIANAVQQGMKEEDLMFKEIQINEGPRLKRWRAGARGRAKPYKRRMSHIRVVLMTKSKAVGTKSRTISKGKKTVTKKKSLKSRVKKAVVSRRKTGGK